MAKGSTATAEVGQPDELLIEQDSTLSYEQPDEQPIEAVRADEAAQGEAEERTTPVDVGPEKGGNLVLSAWDGLYWIFDARVERFDITHDGVFAIGLTFPKHLHTRTILRDMQSTGHTRSTRLELIPQYFWAGGEIPEKIIDPAEATDWMIRFFRGAGEEKSTRTPEYAKKQVADYKKNTGINAPRGRKRKMLKFELENLDNLNPDALAGVPSDKLAALRARIEEAMARQLELEAVEA